MWITREWTKSLLAGALGFLGAVAAVAVAVAAAPGAEGGPAAASAEHDIGRTKAMSPRRHERYKSAREVVGATTQSYEPRTGEAAALPLPYVIGPTRTLRIVVLYYREGMKPGEERVFPPHHKVTVDPATGRVTESHPVVPADFGSAQAAGVPQHGFGLDPAMTASEFWSRKDRFMTLSAAVWELYADGATSLDSASHSVVAEYETCFRRIAKAPLTPYYEAVAGDFLTWLAAVLAKGGA